MKCSQMSSMLTHSLLTQVVDSPTSNLVLSWTWTTCLYASCRTMRTAPASLLLKLSSCCFFGITYLFRSSISSLSHSLSLSHLSFSPHSEVLTPHSLATPPTTSYLSVIVKFHSVCYQHNRPLEAQYLLCCLSILASFRPSLFPLSIFSYRSFQAIFSSLLYRSFIDL